MHQLYYMLFDDNILLLCTVASACHRVYSFLGRSSTAAAAVEDAVARGYDNSHGIFFCVLQVLQEHQQQHVS